MTQHDDLPLEDLGSLAEQVIDDKRRESGSEEQARELYDVPSQSPGTMAREQPKRDEG
jgi:hypothetical protein